MIKKIKSSKKKPTPRELASNVFGWRYKALAEFYDIPVEENAIICKMIESAKKELENDHEKQPNEMGFYLFQLDFYFPNNDHKCAYCTEEMFNRHVDSAHKEAEAKHKAEEESKKSMTLIELFGDSESVSLQAGQPIWVSHNGSDILLAIGEAMSAPVYEDTAFKKGWFFPLKVSVSKTGRGAIINDVFCTQKMKDQITKGTEVVFAGYLREDDGKISSYCNTVRPTPLDTPLFDY